MSNPVQDFLNSVLCNTKLLRHPKQDFGDGVVIEEHLEPSAIMIRTEDLEMLAIACKVKLPIHVYRVRLKEDVE